VTNERIAELWQQHEGEILAFARAVARESQMNGQSIEDAVYPEPNPQKELFK